MRRLPLEYLYLLHLGHPHILAQHHHLPLLHDHLCLLLRDHLCSLGPLLVGIRLRLTLHVTGPPPVVLHTRRPNHYLADIPKLKVALPEQLSMLARTPRVVELTHPVYPLTQLHDAGAGSPTRL